MRCRPNTLWLAFPDTGLSTLTHNTAPHWTPSVSTDQGSSLAQQVGNVMPHSAAFLIGPGTSADPESAILLDTNIQVRIRRRNSLCCLLLCTCTSCLVSLIASVACVHKGKHTWREQWLASLWAVARRGGVCSACILNEAWTMQAAAAVWDGGQRHVQDTSGLKHLHDERGEGEL